MSGSVGGINGSGGAVAPSNNVSLTKLWESAEAEIKVKDDAVRALARQLYDNTNELNEGKAILQKYNFTLPANASFVSVSSNVDIGKAVVYYNSFAADGDKISSSTLSQLQLTKMQSEIQLHLESLTYVSQQFISELQNKTNELDTTVSAFAKLIEALGEILKSLSRNI